MMMPIEKYNNDLLYVLDKVNEKSLYTLKDKFVEYRVDYSVIMLDEKYPTAENETRLLEKLEEMGAIRIARRENSPSDIMVEAEIFSLGIIQPKFDTVYKKLKAPLLKKEKYTQQSAESIKKILCILEKLKAEWDLLPKEDFIENDGVLAYYKTAGQSDVSDDQYFEWMSTCNIPTFQQLQNILATLKQEDIIVDFEAYNEYV